MPSSYNGWPASTDPRSIGINAAWAPLGVRFPNGVKSGDVETILTQLVLWLNAEVEPIDLPGPKDEWGYYYKPSTNSPTLLSCHASGTAIDYNATRHPNRKRGTWTKAQVDKIHDIVNLRLSGVVRWLGDTTGTPDEMHFEIRGTPERVRQIADKLRAVPPPPPPAYDIVQEITSMDPLGGTLFAFANCLDRHPGGLEDIAWANGVVQVYGLDWLIGMIFNDSPEGRAKWGVTTPVDATGFAEIFVAYQTALHRQPESLGTLVYHSGILRLEGFGGLVNRMMFSEEGKALWGL